MCGAFILLTNTWSVTGGTHSLARFVSFPFQVILWSTTVCLDTPWLERQSSHVNSIPTCHLKPRHQHVKVCLRANQEQPFSKSIKLIHYWLKKAKEFWRFEIAFASYSQLFDAHLKLNTKTAFKEPIVEMVPQVWSQMSKRKAQVTLGFTFSVGDVKVLTHKGVAFLWHGWLECLSSDESLSLLPLTVEEMLRFDHWCRMNRVFFPIMEQEGACALLRGDTAKVPPTHLRVRLLLCIP